MTTPQYSAGEVGDVDAVTVVITFDQDVALAEPEPESKPGSSSRAVDMTAALYGDALIPVGHLGRRTRG